MALINHVFSSLERKIATKTKFWGRRTRVSYKSEEELMVHECVRFFFLLFFSCWGKLNFHVRSYTCSNKFNFAVPELQPH